MYLYYINLFYKCNPVYNITKIAVIALNKNNIKLAINIILYYIIYYNII